MPTLRISARPYRRVEPLSLARWQGGHTSPQQKAVPGVPMASRRLRARPREKMFGLGRPRALDRNAKARIMHLARGLSRRTDKGKAYGQITAKALAVLEEENRT